MTEFPLQPSLQALMLVVSVCTERINIVEIGSAAYDHDGWRTLPHLQLRHLTPSSFHKLRANFSALPVFLQGLITIIDESC